MKMFDLGELRKSARLQETSRSKSISDITKSPRRASDSPLNDSFYLSRWGLNLENRGNRQKNHPWVNVGQGIYSIAVGEKHAIILNNKNECYGCGNNNYGQLALEQPQVTRPVQISALKDMKIVGVYCGAYHTFVQNSKGEVYAFGLNMKGQLGIGSFQNERKPMLVYSLLPSGSKNPKAQAYIQTSQYQKKARQQKRQPFGEVTNLDNLIKDVQQNKTQPDVHFHLHSDEMVSHMACGPLHSLALTNKGRLFSCGFGQHFTLGTGDKNGSSQFVEVKSTKLSRIEKVETGLAFICVVTVGGKAYICGRLGQNTYQQLTPVVMSDEVRDVRCSENSCIFLSKKGDVYQLGEYRKDSGDVYHAEIPRKIDRLSYISSIFGGLCGFFAVCENKNIWGWGDNSHCQITGGKTANFLTTPNQLKVPITASENLRIIPGTTTTYLLSGRPLDIDYEKYDSAAKENNSGSLETMKKSLTKKKSLIRTNEKNLLEEIGVEPRTFNHNFEIDFKELTFEKQISEGGYGIIYKGRWRETTVAIKIFKIESESAVRDFFSECAAMQALRHPNIVMFLGACTKPPNLAIVLEYCCRGSLWSTIQDLNIQLTWQDRRRFALDTAKGVHYLHSCNPPIIHRDLKSLNLLLDDSYRVKLADFGWTKGLDKYMTGKIGTYQWMAPEVIGSEQYSEKADVFSFGIILWEIASREPPYRNLTGLEVSIEVLNNDLRPSIPKKTPEAFSRLMKRCWDKEPSKRPSFKDIVKDLETMKF